MQDLYRQCVVIDARWSMSYVSPGNAIMEGAACFAALEKLLRDGFLKKDDEIVIYNTGTGLKYLDNWATQFPPEPRAEEKLGGLILPR